MTKILCKVNIGVMSAFCAALVIVSVASFSPDALSQTYPTKPIRLIVPMAPGGASDILGRLVGQKLTEQLGQPVVIENRGGSGGNIGCEIAAKAKPDGYTILLSTPGAIFISPSLYKKLNYNPIKDFAPIVQVAQMPNLLLIYPPLPVKNLKEFVEYAKANPGKLNYGTSGIGTANQLAAELLKSLAKIEIVHVPYKSAGQSLVALMSGEVDMLVIGTQAALPQIQAGKIRALAVLSEKRVPSLPNVPTTQEAGIDNFEMTSSYGILAPAGTPRYIVNRLNAEWIKIVAMPDTREKLKSAEAEPLSGTPEQFAEFIKKEIARWGKVIKEANISLD